MIELERHIELLLLDNDCIIVPGLGGFVAHYVEARYDDKDNMFLPPLRTIGFNPKLNINDSLLAQSYVEVHDISYPEAINRIETDVNELLNVLNKDRRYDVTGIGTIFFNEDGYYEFQPCEAGLLTPELYGLCSFEIPSVCNDVPVWEEHHVVETTVDVDEENSDDSEKTISIRVSWLRNIAAAAIAIFAFFIISPSIGDNGNELALMNFNENLLFRFMPKDVTIPVKNVEDTKPCVKTVTDTVNKNVATVEIVDENVAGKVQEDSVAKLAEQYFTIVLASKVSKNNAEDYVERLHKIGIDDAFVHKSKSNVIRVLCGRYKTEIEAYNALNRKHSDDIFSQGWIFKVKE